jgi:hypothetical protein
MTVPPNTSIPGAPEDERILLETLRRAIASLQTIIEKETGFIRAGDLTGSTQLAAEKSDASRGYVAAVTRAQKGQRYMARLLPDTLQSLHDQHEKLRAALQVNLTVLATAHAVSEAVVRGVNMEVQKRTMPQTYTAYGQRTAPGPRNVVPISVSRTM